MLRKADNTFVKDHRLAKGALDAVSCYSVRQQHRNFCCCAAGLTWGLAWGLWLDLRLDLGCWIDLELLA